MTAGRGSRALRATVFAAVCVLLAALGHVLMSGSSVDRWTLAAGVVVTGGVGWCLAGRERGLPLVVAVVVVAQGALHSVFSITQGMVTGPAGTATDSMGMAHTGTGTGMGMRMDMGAGAGAGHPAHGGYGTDVLSSSYGMLAAHTLAALLCGLWLAYGERAAFRIVRAVAVRLVAPLRLILTPPVTPDWLGLRPRPRRNRSDRAPRLLPLVHTITSRGPPAGIAVV
ncbi:hypothetical protein OG241_41425 [Streptomyces sp. NBC_01390]|uniref:hypothetical protein n=1 Tax=Streptomyces sp. NBC_01390 TaxID=2903850 RepID=UPI003246C370